MTWQSICANSHVAKLESPNPQLQLPMSLIHQALKKTEQAAQASKYTQAQYQPSEQQLAYQQKQNRLRFVITGLFGVVAVFCVSLSSS